MNEKFEQFISQLKKTNATLSFFSDFPKIKQRVDNVAISLAMLNYLIGKDNLRNAVEALWRRDRSVFQVMDILIATRKEEQKLFIDGDGNVSRIHSLFDSVDGVMTFLEDTGLASVLRNQEIKNFEDYVFGVETGLDTNARKNRGGKLMEQFVREFFKEEGIEFTEQESSRVHSKVAAVLGADTKRFDFVVRTLPKTYLIEVNFYSSGGSKLNEVARAYTDIGPKINSIPDYEFVWITDGTGWYSAKNKLQEAFASIPSVYNISTLPDLIRKIKADNATPLLQISE